jgi:putative MATE family efflux protein
MTSGEQRLGTQSLPGLLCSLAIPSIIAQLVNLLYNIVDRMYIGHISGVGSLALTGVGLCSPIILIISAFSSFAGQGGAPLAAIEMGKGDKKAAERILGNAIVMLVTCSVVLTVLFAVFKTPLLYLFGASEDTIGYATDYMTIYLCGTLFVQLSLGLNQYITCQGQSRVAMLSVLIGAVANTILDPIFIFVFGLGVRGAALATVISQFFSAVWVVSFLLSKKSALAVTRETLVPRLSVIGRIAALGVSPFIMQSTESLIQIVFLSGLQRYGNDLYVGSMTILQSIMQLAVVPVQGFNQGVQPVVSYNYGAGNHARVKKCFRAMLVVSLSYTCLFFIAAACFPRAFGYIFTSNAELIDLIGEVLPIYLGGVWIFGVQMAVQCTIVGLGQAKVSAFIACLRKIILLTPLAIILPRFFGVMGIYWAEPISDIISATTSGVLFFILSRRLLKSEN